MLQHSKCKEVLWGAILLDHNLHQLLGWDASLAPTHLALHQWVIWVSQTSNISPLNISICLKSSEVNTLSGYKEGCEKYPISRLIPFGCKDFGLTLPAK